jgi:hypothetical protein
MSIALLQELENTEFKMLDALGRTAPGSRRHVQLRALLERARSLKASLLAGGDILRKSAGRLTKIGLPVPPDAVAKAVREAKDRAAEERRLSGREGKRRYRAPENLRGQSVRLVDGRELAIPKDGAVEVAAAGHPAGGESAVHHQLVSMDFRPLPGQAEEERDTGMEEVGKALARPIIGDAAFVQWLGRSVGSR